MRPVLKIIFTKLEHHPEGILGMELSLFYLTGFYPPHEPDTKRLQVSDGLLNVRNLQGDSCQALPPVFNGFGNCTVL